MKTITTQQLQAKIEAGEAVHLIDVREVDEVEAGHIPGIVNIPLGLLPFRLQELNKHAHYYIVCRSGGRSGQATMLLASQGFNVTNMTGGMLEWAGEVK